MSRAVGGDMSDESRFWTKVNKTDSCWLWIAAHDGDGYGRFWLGGRLTGAHRVAYTWAVGDILDDMQIDHLCHTSSCVNPDHLRVVTRKQNQENRHAVRDGDRMRGASWHKAIGKWYAYVRHNRHLYSAGYYTTQEEAAEAARQLRLSLFTHNNPDRKVTA